MKKIFFKYYSSIISVFLAFFSALLILILLSKNPIEIITDFFSGIFSSKFYFGKFINTTGVLLIASLGCAKAIKTGNFNLGGAGQIYISGLITALLLKNPDFPFFIALLIASITAGLVSMISGILKIFKNINELLSSFLISSAIVPILDYAISGPLRDSTKNLLATPYIAQCHRLKNIFPNSNINITIFFAIILCLGVYYFYYKSSNGKMFSMCGVSLEYSKYCGYNTNLINILSMFYSGLFHGICGFFCIVGNYYTCHSGFYGGLNWDAISISLIGHNHPLILIPASFLISYIFTSCDYISMTHNFSFDINALIQSGIFITVSAKFLFKKNNEKIKLFEWHNLRKRGE